MRDNLQTSQNTNTVVSISENKRPKKVVHRVRKENVYLLVQEINSSEQFQNRFQ